MKKGEEKEFAISYDDDFVIKEAAGKEVNFKVKLNDIKERVLPELSDEFAKQYELANMEELKKRIEEDLEKQLEDQADGKLRQDIIKKLLAKYNFDLPQSLLDQEKNFLLSRYANDYQSKGLEVPDITKNVQSNIDKRSETNVKVSIVLGKIADNEDIFVSDAEVDNTLKEMAAMYRIPFDQFKQTYEKNNLLQGLESRLTEQKVLDFMIEKAKIKTASAKGRGLFAKNDISKNEIITFYPADIASYIPNEDVIKPDHIPVETYSQRFKTQFGENIKKEREIAATMNEYTYDLDPNYRIIGSPYFTKDTNYMGHVINDGAKSDSTESNKVYLTISSLKSNCTFYHLKDLHVAIIATKNIKKDEELYITYGVEYWESYNKRKLKNVSESASTNGASINLL